MSNKHKLLGTLVKFNRNNIETIGVISKVKARLFTITHLDNSKDTLTNSYRVYTDLTLINLESLSFTERMENAQLIKTYDHYDRM